jgi:two-component system nitrogen regulation response regulator GlnG/two-component system response regulator HydG
VGWVRQRPGLQEDAAPLRADAALLTFHPRGDEIEVLAAPGRTLRVDGVETAKACLQPGVIVSVANEIVLVGVRRPAKVPALRSFPISHVPAFGQPDAFGWVGESAESWRVRDLVSVAARAPAHVLVLGPSGVGKGIVARAIHGLSPRSNGPLVICSDGQLGGNDDAVARASGGTLVIDPGEALGPEAQSRLLHVARTQRLDSLAAAGQTLMQIQVVVLARKLDGSFHEELRSRFLTVTLPSFDARREDLALIARARALALARTMPELGGHFVTQSPTGAATVLLDGELVEALLLRRWTAGGFEVDRLLFQAMSESAGHVLALPSTLSRRPPSAAPAASPAHPARPVGLAERLGLPAPAAWGELRIRPVDGLTVLVTVRTRSARCTHVELGLASAKSRGPTKAWELLLATCEGRGSFDWRRFGETRDTARKQVERLSEALTSAFGLDEPPFAPFDPRRGWVARFLAVPER